MLCYQSSRSASDIVHDAFFWLTSNARALGSCCILILAGCIGTLFIATPLVDMNSISENLADNVSDNLFHFTDTFYPDKAIDLASNYALVAFVTTFVLTPMLITYFVDRRSILKMTFTKFISLARQHFWVSLLSSLVTAVVFFMLPQASIFVFMLALAAWSWLWPSIVMSRFGGIDIIANIWTYLKTLFFVVLIFSVVRLLPIFCLTILEAMLEMSQTIAVSDLLDTPFLSPIVKYSMGMLLALCFSAAVAVSQVCVLLLHGVVYDN